MTHSLQPALLETITAHIAANSVEAKARYEEQLAARAMKKAKATGDGHLSRSATAPSASMPQSSAVGGTSLTDKPLSSAGSYVPSAVAHRAAVGAANDKNLANMFLDFGSANSTPAGSPVRVESGAASTAIGGALRAATAAVDRRASGVTAMTSPGTLPWPDSAPSSPQRPEPTHKARSSMGSVAEAPSRRMTGTAEELEAQYAAIQAMASAVVGAAAADGGAAAARRRSGGIKSGRASVASSHRLSILSTGSAASVQSAASTAHSVSGRASVSGGIRGQQSGPEQAPLVASPRDAASSASAPPSAHGSPASQARSTITTASFRIGSAADDASSTAGGGGRTASVAAAVSEVSTLASSSSSIAGSAAALGPAKLPRVATLPPRQSASSKAPVKATVHAAPSSTAAPPAVPSAAAAATASRLYHEAQEKKERAAALAERYAEQQKRAWIEERRKYGKDGEPANLKKRSSSSSASDRGARAELRLYAAAAEDAARRDRERAEKQAELQSKADSWICAACGGENAALDETCKRPSKYGKAVTNAKAGHLKVNDRSAAADEGSGGMIRICGSNRPAEFQPVISAYARRLADAQASIDAWVPLVGPSAADVGAGSVSVKQAAIVAHVDAQIEAHFREQQRREDAALEREEAQLAEATFKPQINRNSEALAEAARRRKLAEMQQQRQQPADPANTEASAIPVHEALYHDARARKAEADEAASRPAPWHGCTFQPEIGRRARSRSSSVERQFYGAGDQQERENHGHDGGSVGNAADSVVDSVMADILMGLQDGEQRAKPSKHSSSANGGGGGVHHKSEAEARTFFERLHRHGADARDRVLASRQRLEASTKLRQQQNAAKLRAERGGAHIGEALYAAAMKAAADRAATDQARQDAAAERARGRHTSKQSHKMLADMRARCFAGVFRLLVQSMDLSPDQRRDEAIAQADTMRTSSDGPAGSEAYTSAASAAQYQQKLSFTRADLVSLVAAMEAHTEAASDDAAAGFGIRKEAGQASLDVSREVETMLTDTIITSAQDEFLDIDAVWTGCLVQPQLILLADTAMARLRQLVDFNAGAPQGGGDCASVPSSTASGVGMRHPLSPAQRLVSFAEFCASAGRILEEAGGGPNVYLVSRKQRKADAVRAALQSKAKAAEPTFAPQLDAHSMEIVERTRGGAAAHPLAADAHAASTNTSVASASTAATHDRLLQKGQQYAVHAMSREIDELRAHIAAHPFQPVPQGAKGPAALAVHGAADPELRSQMLHRQATEDITTMAKRIIRSDALNSAATSASSTTASLQAAIGALPPLPPLPVMMMPGSRNGSRAPSRVQSRQASPTRPAVSAAPLTGALSIAASAPTSAAVSVEASPVRHVAVSLGSVSARAPNSTSSLTKPSPIQLQQLGSSTSSYAQQQPGAATQILDRSFPFPEDADAEESPCSTSFMGSIFNRKPGNNFGRDAAAFNALRAAAADAPQAGSLPSVNEADATGSNVLDGVDADYSPVKHPSQQAAVAVQNMLMSPTRFIAARVEDYGYTPMGPITAQEGFMRSNNNNSHIEQRSDTAMEAAELESHEQAVMRSSGSGIASAKAAGTMHGQPDVFSSLDSSPASAASGASYGQPVFDENVPLHPSSTLKAGTRSAGVDVSHGQGSTSLDPEAAAAAALDKSTALLERLSKMSMAALGARIERILATNPGDADAGVE